MTETNRQNSANDRQPAGRVAGVDFGTVRIGIAISDPSRTWSSPLEIRTRSGQEADARYFRRLVEENRITLFVVGLPVYLDGNESEKSIQAREFALWLTETTGVPHELFDERFTSVEAENFLLAANLTKKRRKKRIDKVAAQILLAAYLESTANREKSPGQRTDDSIESIDDD